MANGEGRTLTVVHEESRLTARRGSASSVVYISHTHSDIETTDGFDVIGRLSPKFIPDDTESVSSEFEYMPNPYSVRATGSGVSTPVRSRRASGAGSDTPPPSRTRSGGGRGRRRSSASEVLIPMAMVAAHVVAAGLLLTQH